MLQRVCKAVGLNYRERGLIKDYIRNGTMDNCTYIRDSKIGSKTNNFSNFRMVLILKNTLNLMYEMTVVE